MHIDVNELTNAIEIKTVGHVYKDQASELETVREKFQNDINDTGKRNGS